MNRLRPVLPLTLMSLLVLLPSCAFSHKPEDLARNDSIINTFSIMCRLEPLKFDYRVNRATAMRMPLVTEKNLDLGNNTTTRSKMWAGGLTTGHFIFSVDEMTEPTAVSTSCAVIADEMHDLEAFYPEALKRLGLKSLPAPVQEPDGGKAYIWENPSGSATKMIIREMQFVGKPHLMIKSSERMEKSAK